MCPEPTDSELDVFGDFMNEESESIGNAAQQIASQMTQTPPQQMIPQTASPQTAQGIIAPPPSAPVPTAEQKEMNAYNEDKKKLFNIEKQLFEISHSDKSGAIIRNFGLSQILLQIGDELDRLNGLVILRALKARCKSVVVTKDVEGKKKDTCVTDQEELANCMYEVWGIMEDGSVGLTSSYAPSMVKCVISLRSGYDLPPEAE